MIYVPPTDSNSQAITAVATPVSSSYQSQQKPTPAQEPTQVVTVAAAQQYPQVTGGTPYVHIASRDPVVLSYCPKCQQQQVATRTRTKATGTTCVLATVTFCVFWPLFWVPFVARPCKQTNHYCAKCGNKVGRVKPFQ
eukprot:Nitzschia sp. Nitz4//scaffold16_size188269//28917//29330//NITZ4_001774-RA/size188269-exonerate_protein2genome-gene-0.133-mRNA-1//1//CDS//3329538464//3494//frame0